MTDLEALAGLAEAYDVEACPACGALPCDWVNDPHQSSRIAELEEALGRIANVSERWDDSLLSQINEIARNALVSNGGVL